jgi:endothelin-converting enzyme
MTKLLHAGLIAVPIYGALSSPSLDAISGPGGSSDSGVCKSTKCEEVAAYIKKSLAPNYMALDPCVDFEQYACNGWANTHDITPSQNTTTPPDVLSDDNDRIIQAALTGPYMANTTLSGVNAFDRKNFQKIQQTYAACMNDDSIKAYGVTPLRKMLDEFDAVFPANATNSSAYDLTGALIWLFKRDVTSMIALSSAVSAAQLPSVGLTRQADNTNNYTTILQTAMPGEGLRSTSYFFDLQKPVPAKTVAEMFQVIWSAKSIDEEPIPLSRNGSLFKKAQHVVDYERLLFPYVNGSAFDQRNVSYNSKPSINPNDRQETKTVHELQKLIPEIDFLRFLQGVAPPTFRIDINQEVQVFHMDYYRNLSRIINSSSRDTLRAYFQWQLITMWADRFHDSYSAPIQRYQNQILERDLNYTDPRPDTCRLEVYINLPYLYDGMFIQRAFTMKDKVLGERIVRELRDAITADVKTRRWMTEKSKASVAMKGTARRAQQPS